MVNVVLFLQQVDIASYSDIEYNAHLRTEGWSQAETDQSISFIIIFR